MMLAFFVALAVLAFMGYRTALSHFDDDPFATARDKEAREIAELTALVADARSARAYAASDQFVEQEARQRLGWVREGEVAVVVHSPPLEGPPPSGKRWWQRIFFP
jgi:cell division protein FtsB